MKDTLQKLCTKKVKIFKPGGFIMKISIELNREEFDMALDTGALKALSMSLKKPDEEKIKQETPVSVPVPVKGNTPVQTVNPAGPAPIPTPASSTPVPVQTTIPMQAPPVQSVAPVQMPTAVPTTTQSYTMEQLAVAATQLVDAGRRNELVGLLQAFGVRALTMLPKEQYGTFATKLREMGAKI